MNGIKEIRVAFADIDHDDELFIVTLMCNDYPATFFRSLGCNHWQYANDFGIPSVPVKPAQMWDIELELFWDVVRPVLDIV